MTITLYSASVPIFTRMLGNLSKWLDKAEAYAEAKKFDPSVFMSSRLAPDMLPFPNQIQIACDSIKFGVARLSGVDAPKFEDNETTLAQLKDRIAKTLAYVQSVGADKIDGTEDKDISIPRRSGVLVMKGEPYLRHYVMPTFYFHVTTAYALMRHNGVDLGKSDFLGALQ